MKWIPNEKQAIALTMRNVREVFYGGARGGGRTDFLIADFLNGVSEWGDEWTGILFRHSPTQIEQAVRRAKQIYVPLARSITRRKTVLLFPTALQSISGIWRAVRTAGIIRAAPAPGQALTNWGTAAPPAPGT